MQVENYPKNKSVQAETLADKEASPAERCAAEHLLPSGVEAMAMVTESKFPKPLQDVILRLNRTGLNDAVRAGLTFVPTIINEIGTVVEHTTVAGLDQPNIVCQQTTDADGRIHQVLLVSTDKESKFLKAEEMQRVTTFIATTTYEVSKAIGDWKEQGGSLQDLNQQLEQIYLSATNNVAQVM